MKRPESQPEPGTQRPPEPVRPEPARNPGVGLLVVRARRRRYGRLQPPGV